MSVQSKIETEINEAEALVRSGRERTPLNEAAQQAELQRRIAAAQAMAREGIEAPPGPGLPLQGREREPFGMMEQTLAHPPIPGYRLYWANDTPGRIARFKRAGYEHVLDDTGAPLQRCVDVRGGGGGVNAYLMKIPLQWYWDDMAAQQAQRDRTIGDIKSGRFGANPGQNQYVPQNGIQIQDQRR